MLDTRFRSLLRLGLIAIAGVAFSTQALAVSNTELPSRSGSPILDALADPDFLDGVFGPGTADKFGLTGAASPSKNKSGAKQAFDPFPQFQAPVEDLFEKLVGLRLAALPARPSDGPSPPSVPEPGLLWLLLGTGLTATALASRRR